MTDSTKALLGTMCALLTLVAIVAIMARCSVEVNGLQVAAAECAKRGGIWHPSADATARFCEEKGK